MHSRRRFLTGAAGVWSVLPALPFTPSHGQPAEDGGAGTTRRFVDVDGIRTSYFEAGQGEPMVLVHGGHFGGPISSAISWSTILPRLASRFHVRAVDKLGMGFTANPAVDADYSMEAVVEHLRGFLKKMGIQRVHLAGQSRGALPVARLALDHPEMVQTLTLFNSNTLAPGDPAPKTPDISPLFSDPSALDAAAIRRRLEGLYTPGRVSAAGLEKMTRAHLEVARLPKTRQVAERFELLRSRWAERNRDLVRARPGLARNSGTGWWLYRVKDDTLAAIRAGGLRTPTLIIWGANDAGADYGLGLDLFELIRSSVGRTRFYMLNQCGHHAFTEYPEEVAGLMEDFIQGSARPGRTPV